MRWGVAAVLLLCVASAGCVRRPTGTVGPTRYLVGAGYQAGGTWFYPKEDFHYDATGLASVLPDRGGVTVNGEARDATAMVAAHQTLQLPSIVRVTNLDTGASALVRVNDRGPASAGRMIALSPRAARLLGISGTGRVRVQVDEAQSQALRDQLNGGPRLTVAAAPRTGVQSETLAPPSGVKQSSRGRSAGGPVAVQASAVEETARVPDRLPEVVEQGAAMPGQLVIRAGSFGQAQYAQRVAAQLSGIGAQVGRVRDGRSERFEVRAGPFGSVNAADAALDRALRAGVSDARIVVE